MLLSRQQAEIVAMMAEGKSHQEIADELTIPETKVASEARTVYRMTGILGRCTSPGLRLMYLYGSGQLATALAAD